MSPENAPKRQVLFTGLTIMYLSAFAGGLLLVGSAAFEWWRSERALVEPEPVGLDAGDGAAENPRPAPPLAATAPVSVPSPATVPTPAAKNAGTPDSCTDLRALFGLGANLSDSQKDYLLKHC